MSTRVGYVILFTIMILVWRWLNSEFCKILVLVLVLVLVAHTNTSNKHNQFTILDCLAMKSNHKYHKHQNKTLTLCYACQPYHQCDKTFPSPPFFTLLKIASPYTGMFSVKTWLENQLLRPAVVFIYTYVLHIRFKAIFLYLSTIVLLTNI